MCKAFCTSENELNCYLCIFFHRNAVHLFFFLACSLAALAAGFSRTLELVSKGETNEINKNERITALRMVFLSTALVLLFSAGRSSLGSESTPCDGGNKPRYSLAARMSFRVTVSLILVALCFLVAEKLSPTWWMVVIPSLLVVELIVETWACTAKDK